MSISDSFKLGKSLSRSTSELTKSFDRLSSGSRINRASDDAAGLAIAEALAADVVTSLQSSRNAVDGVSIAAIAEGSLQQISDISTRQAELATQAANGALSDTQRSTLNAEFQQLDQEKQRILSSTQFNGTNVFSGVTLQVGTDGSSNSQISLPSVDTSSVVASLDISSASNARQALDSVKSQIDNLSKIRGQIGSSVSRLETADSNSRTRATESKAAESRIRDVDVASETANLTGARIRQQTTVALSAQTNKLSAPLVAKLLG